MIERFDLRNFKSHRETNYFDLPGLTIVSGTNNSGKSSLLQSIYLLTQAKNKKYPYLAINDELKLGAFSDVLNKMEPNTESLEFGFSFDRNFLVDYNIENLIINLYYKNPNNLNEISLLNYETNPILVKMEIVIKTKNEDQDVIALNILDKKDKNVLYEIQGDLDKGFCHINGIIPEPIIYDDENKENRAICSPNLDVVRDLLKLVTKGNINYIKAFRVENFADGNKAFNDVGLSGEYTAEVIHGNQDVEVDFVLEESQVEKVTFSDVFNFWIKELLGDDFRISATSVDKDKFKIEIHDIKTKNVYSLNQVGFGISQILPILTLMLSSKENEIILIENPEVHLHPRLQSMFLDLCIFVLQNNRKIVIETHSEHIINRLRLRVKEDPELLNKVNVLFFEKSNEGNTEITEIEISRDGRLSFWPEDFFDQTYKDLLGLIE